MPFKMDASDSEGADEWKKMVRERAHKEGVEAFKANKRIEENPYEKDTDPYNEWMIGWMKAQEESQK